MAAAQPKKMLIMHILDILKNIRTRTTVSARRRSGKS